MNMLKPLAPHDMQRAKSRMATRQFRRDVMRLRDKMKAGWTPALSEAAAFLKIPPQVVVDNLAPHFGGSLPYTSDMILQYDPSTGTAH